MKKYLVTASLALSLLTACETTAPTVSEKNADRRNFYPVYVSDRNYHVQAYAEAGMFKSIVTVIIDEKVAIQQPTKGISATQTFSGSHDGTPVYARATLNMVSGIVTHTVMEVFLDGKLIATLRTKPSSDT